MPTNAKCVIVSVIKQGKTLWRVRCYIGNEEVPRVSSVVRSSSTRSLSTYRTPSPSKPFDDDKKTTVIWRFGIRSGVASVNTSQPFRLSSPLDNQNQYFLTKQSAERYANAYLQRLPA